MKELTLKIDDEIFEKFMALLELMPNGKIIIEKQSESVKENPWEIINEISDTVQENVKAESPFKVIKEVNPTSENPWDMIMEMADSVEGPEDSSANHDHYIHGTTRH